MKEFINKILQGDWVERMKQMPSCSVDCVVTSVPYWALRDYGVEKTIWPEVRFTLFSFEIVVPAMECCLGLEEKPEWFVGHIVYGFREAHRCLKDTGTVWLNIGDSYAGSGKVRKDDGVTRWGGGNVGSPGELKPKDLAGIPWMLAFALRADGWYLRQDIIWHKPNPMPESVTDRCTKAHEYIFLFSKSRKYYYDAEAIKEAVGIKGNANSFRGGAYVNGNTDNSTLGNRTVSGNSMPTVGGRKHKNLLPHGQRLNTLHRTRNEHGEEFSAAMANKRSVWTMSKQPFAESHFATFPEELPATCIKAGCSEHGCCSSCGKPWVRIVEKEATAISQKTPVGWETEKGSHDTIHRNGRTQVADKKESPVYISTTTGWKPTCACNAEIVPSIVLDFFLGAGTTAMVAAKLQRDFIGIELNPQYIKIAQRRLQKELGMFNTLKEEVA